MNLLNVNIKKCGVSILLSANVQANTVFDHNIECGASLELVFEKDFFSICWVNRCDHDF